MPRRVSPGMLGTINWTVMAGSFGAGWADYGAGFQACRYGFDEAGNVHLQGLAAYSGANIIQNGTSTIFTLPANGRPVNGSLMFPAIVYGNANGVHATRLDVQVAGAIALTQLYATAQGWAWASLAGVYFPAEA